MKEKGNRKDARHGRRQTRPYRTDTAYRIRNKEGWQASLLHRLPKTERSENTGVLHNTGMDECINSLSNATIISTLDAKSRCW